MPSLNQITAAVEADRKLQAKLDEQQATFLMLALVVESGKRADRAGMTLSEFIAQVEAMLQEHRPVVSDMETAHQQDSANEYHLHVTRGALDAFLTEPPAGARQATLDTVTAARDAVTRDIDRIEGRWA